MCHIRSISWTMPYNFVSTDVYLLVQMELDLSREYSHPNFVKLVGYCCEAQEHLLVYEYMQNSGLDTHIFSKQHFLNLS